MMLIESIQEEEKGFSSIGSESLRRQHRQGVDQQAQAAQFQCQEGINNRGKLLKHGNERSLSKQRVNDNVPGGVLMIEEEEEKQGMQVVNFVDDIKVLHYQNNNAQQQTAADQIEATLVQEPQLGEEQVRFLIKHKILQKLALQHQQFVNSQQSYHNKNTYNCRDLLKESVRPELRIVRSVSPSGLYHKGRSKRHVQIIGQESQSSKALSAHQLTSQRKVAEDEGEARQPHRFVTRQDRKLMIFNSIK